MQKFTDELLVESFGDTWVLKRAFHFYYLDKVGGQTHVIIPEGFITDFASTPKALYSIFPPIGIYNKAAMVHDFLYSKDCPVVVERQIADKFFLQAMGVLGVAKRRRKLMFYAVRLFGQSHFRT